MFQSLFNQWLIDLKGECMGRVGVADKNTLVKNLLLIEGVSRSGKFFLGKILDGFERIEHFQYISIIEQLPFFVRLGMMKREVVKSLMQSTIDDNARNLQFGRNLNFQASDHSCILKAPRAKEYLERTKLTNPSHIIKNLSRGKMYSTFVVHECMPNIEIFFDVCPAVKIISIQRYPIDLVHSWYLRGWGLRQATDLLATQPCIKKNGIDIPWYACQWKESYNDLSPMDRVIKSINSFFKMGRKCYMGLTDKQKKQILFIAYEDLIEKTDSVVECIAKFLKVKAFDELPEVLKREGCYKILDKNDRKKKIDEIKSKASSQTFKMLMQLTKEYESKGARILL